MKRKLFAILCLSSLTALGQNKLDAYSRIEYTNNVIDYKDSISYNYAGIIDSDYGEFKPKLEEDTGLKIFELFEKTPNFKFSEEYYGLALVLDAENTNIYGVNGVDTTLTSNSGMQTGKTEYQYDVNGQLISKTKYYYNQNVLDYVITESIEFTYDANNIIEEKQTLYSNGAISNISKDSSFYDSSNNLIGFKSYYLDNGVFELEVESVSYYNGSDVQYGYYLESNTTGNPLDTIFRLEYTYQGNEISEINGYQFNDPGFDPMPFIEISYQYNGSGDISEIESIFYSAEIEKREFFYNSIDQVEKIITSNNDNGSLEVVEIKNYYFSSSVGLAENEIPFEMVLFPNPVVNQMQLLSDTTIEEVLIVNAEGKVQLHQKQNTSNLDLEFLPKGIYFLKANTSEGSITKRFIKS